MVAKANIEKLYGFEAINSRGQPKIIITQHPDHATVLQCWNRELQIKPGQIIGMAGNLEEELEIKLLIQEMKERGMDGSEVEFMIDYEGKGTAYALFKALVKMVKDMGMRRLRITPRLPALTESIERNAHVALEVRHANLVATEEKLAAVIQEAILPQVKGSGDFSAIRRYWSDCLNSTVIDAEGGVGKMNIIALLEDVSQVSDFLQLFEGQEKVLRPNSAIPLRVMLAMSDPAMKSGGSAARIALRLGLSQLYRKAVQDGKPISVIFGGGTLPFRGGINPDFIGKLLERYPAETVTVQCALLYDYSKEEEAKWKVFEAVSDFRSSFAVAVSRLLNEVSEEVLAEGRGLVKRFSLAYEEILGFLVVQVQKIAHFVPDRRQRTLDKIRGSIIYNGEPVLFERAIKHNAALLGLGFDSTLACLKAISGMKKEEIAKLYEIFDPLGKEYMRMAAYFTLPELIKKSHPEFYGKIQPCLEIASEIAEIPLTQFGGIVKDHPKYESLTDELIWHSMKSNLDAKRAAYLIVNQGLIRRALG